MATKIRKLIAFYVDAGQLAPDKVKPFISSLKENNKELLDRLPEDIGVLWLPGRNFGGETKLEICDLS